MSSSPTHTLSPPMIPIAIGIISISLLWLERQALLFGLVFYRSLPARSASATLALSLFPEHAKSIPGLQWAILYPWKAVPPDLATASPCGHSRFSSKEPFLTVLSKAHPGCFVFHDSVLFSAWHLLPSQIILPTFFCLLFAL